jgi:hypothetical protein
MGQGTAKMWRKFVMLTCRKILEIVSVEIVFVRMTLCNACLHAQFIMKNVTAHSA